MSKDIVKIGYILVGIIVGLFISRMPMETSAVENQPRVVTIDNSDFDHCPYCGEGLQSKNVSERGR